MQTMNISLPDPLKDFVDHQIAEGRYSRVSEYIRGLIRDDEKRKAEERLEALLLEGLESAESELTKQDFERYPQASAGAAQAPQKEGLTVPAVRKRASAKRDLVEQYGSEHAGVETAERFLANAGESFSDLSGNPGMGAPLSWRSPKLAGLRK